MTTTRAVERPVTLASQVATATPADLLRALAGRRPVGLGATPDEQALTEIIHRACRAVDGQAL